MTQKLFSYGTLRDEKIQRTVFGHTVEGTPDAVVGYRLKQITITDKDAIAISGTDRHTILDPTGNTGDQVEGMVLSLTAHDLSLADNYEDAAYKRASAKLRSGGEAWVYVRA
jgi:gamma-glutamylcyclotransferase (GGCT)/AIG2-like uncharacterized protein YtfP